MNLRAKLLILFVAGILAPVLLAGWLFYRNSLKVVEGMLGEETEAEAARAAHVVESALRARESDLSRLTQTGTLRDYVRDALAQPAPSARNTSAVADNAPAASSLPEPVRAAIIDFVSHNGDHYSAVTLVSAPETERAPFRVEPADSAGSTSPRVSEGDLLPGQLLLDERVWTTSEPKPLRSNVKRGANGTTCIVYTVPVFSPGEERNPRVALVAELRLDALLREAGRDGDATAAASPAQNSSARAGYNAQVSRLLVVLDGTGQIVHHTNHALKYQPAGAAMPYFDAFARSMQAGRVGTDFYTVPADGTRWLASYRPIAGSDLSVAAAS